MTEYTNPQGQKYDIKAFPKKAFKPVSTKPHELPECKDCRLETCEGCHCYYVMKHKEDRLQALADLVVKRERVECDCKNAVIHDTFKKPVCFKCHGTGYVEQVKPGVLLEILEIAMGKMCGSCSRAADSKGNHPCDVCEHIEWNKTIAEARRVLEESDE